MRASAAPQARGWPWLALLFGVAAMGCVRDADTRNDAATLTVLLDGDERSFGPSYDSDPKMLVFLPLVRYDEYYGGTPPLPGVANRWEHSADYRLWTVHINTDLRWHDGVPVTAHDVAFTYDLWRHPDVAYYAGAVRADIAVLDDSTLTFRFPGPSRYLMGGWDVYYPKHLLEHLDPKTFLEWEFWTHPVGNGPFRYVRHVPKTMVELEANPDFFLGQPRIERLLIKFGGQALPELLSGTVDAAQVDAGEVRRLRADGRFEIHVDLAPARWQIFWNHRDPLFADARVRRALTMAIDRRTLHAVLEYPEDTPLFDGLCTGRQFRRGGCGPAVPYDPDGAAALLDAAGWRERGPDGIRRRAGRPFAFTLMAEGSDRVRTAVFVQDNLRRIGVRVDVQTVQGGMVQQLLRDRGFQAALAIMPNSPGHHWSRFGADSPIGYANPELVALLDSARASADPEEIDALYRRLGAIFREDVPVTFLHPRVTYYAAHRRVRGLVSPFQAIPLWGAERLWIEEP